MYTGTYPHSLASIVERESGGHELIPSRLRAVDYDIFGPFELVTPDLFGRGCNYMLFATLLEDAAIAQGVPLHLYETVLYVAPGNSGNECDWQHLSDRQCGDRPGTQCRLFARTCNAVGLARLWALSRGLPQSALLLNDKSPMRMTNEPLAVTTTDAVHFSVSHLLVMGYLPPWQVRDVHWNGAQGLDSLHGVRTLDARTLDLAGVHDLPLLLRVFHPTTGVAYGVSVRVVKPGLAVVVTSMARGHVALTVALLVAGGAPFLDFASEFSGTRYCGRTRKHMHSQFRQPFFVSVGVQQCSSDIAQGHCVIRVSFGCVATAPSWRLIGGAQPLGWMSVDVGGGERVVSQLVRKTGVLQLAIASGAVGACVGSNVTLEVAAHNSWCVTELWPMSASRQVCMSLCFICLMFALLPDIAYIVDRIICVAFGHLSTSRVIANVSDTWLGVWH